MNNSKSGQYKTFYKKIKFFKDLTNNIEEIYNLMKILRAKGSTLPILIYVKISYPNLKYFLNNSNKEVEFKFIHKFLSDAKNDIINKLNSNYKEMINFRFIYGKQINTMLNHIKGRIQINSLLRYILNLTDCDKNINEGKKGFKRLTQDYINEFGLYNDDSFGFINQYITSLFEENNSSIENHYKNILIKENNDLKGIYTYSSQSDSIEEDIIHIFFVNVGNFPIALNILLIVKETSLEEMQAFFNRAILCEYNTLFIVGIKDPTFIQIKYMINLIDELLTYKNKIFNEKNDGKLVEIYDTYSYMNSCLIFIKKGLIFYEFKKFNPKILQMTNFNLFWDIAQKIDLLKKKLCSNIYIIQSEICGLGKSTKIRKMIKMQEKIYIYFPLGGKITKDIIYNKLDNIIKDISKKTKSKFNDIAIHLDLYETKDFSVLNEFLFSFLITKFYSNKEKIIYIPNNIEIFIEIPNSFSDFINNLGILKLFKNEIITITMNNLPELDLSEEKINLFKNVIGVNNNHEIYQWIKKDIFLQTFSYHQINIFMKFFLKQFNLWKQGKVIVKETLWWKEKDVTKEFIESFFKYIRYFTNGNYSKLLLEKKYNNKYNILDILPELYDNDLDNLDFGDKLIIVNENKSEFIYWDISMESLKNGDVLEYLKIFKNKFDLKNPVKPENLKNSNNNLISLLEIIERDDYTITMDNFRKMILIIYRIMANIPVILIGETGCGKTTLIKKLNQLLNNGEEKLEYINIDQKYTYEKLIQTMDKINKKAKIDKDKNELWVFIDDLNTCDSLNLITEIFIKRTYDGNQIEENIRFIGACNPHRKKIINKKDLNDNELVYFTNILPQPLMFYVFNIGNLNKESEYQYTSNIISGIIPDKNLKKATTKAIIKCHDFLRSFLDPSVVSLRDVKRFKKLYCFFGEYYKNKQKLYPKKNYSDESIKLKSIIISIYICYYVRIDDRNKRDLFDNELRIYFI